MVRLLRADSISCAMGLVALACEARVPERRPADVSEPVACEQTIPGRAPLRLLTRLQYDSAIADLLGDTSGPSQVLPPENEVGGFRNNADANLANPLLVEQYHAAAESIAQRAVAERLHEIAPCADGSDENECGRAFVRDFGLRAFRRPLEEAEASVFDGLFSSTHAVKGYAKAVDLVLQAMLQSPQFVYRVDALRAPTQ